MEGKLLVETPAIGASSKVDPEDPITSAEEAEPPDGSTG